MVKLIRVDDRLIHGQVITKWIRYTDATSVVAVDDETAKNPALKSIAAMAVPRSVKCAVCSLEEAVSVVEAMDGEKEKIMVIVRYVPVACELVRSGLKPARVNIGNVAKKRDTSQEVFEVTHTIFITRSDIESLLNIENAGIDIDFQLLPETPLYSWKNVKASLNGVKGG